MNTMIRSDGRVMAREDMLELLTSPASRQPWKRAATAGNERQEPTANRFLGGSSCENRREARKCLDKALAWIVQADIRGAVGDRNAWISWYEAPEVGHLVREARALIEGPALRGDGKSP